MPVCHDTSAVNDCDLLLLHHRVTYLLKACGEHTMKKTATKRWRAGSGSPRVCHLAQQASGQHMCHRQIADLRSRASRGKFLPSERCWYLLKFGHGCRRMMSVQFEISTGHREVSGKVTPKCYCSFVQQENRRLSRTPAVSALTNVIHRGRVYFATAD